MPGILPMKVIKVGSSSQSRIAQACDRCRSKKIRCDGIRPTCTQCSSVGFECRTSDKLSRRAFPRGYTESLEERVRVLELEVRELKDLLDEKDEKIDLLSKMHGNRRRPSVTSDSNSAAASPEAKKEGATAREDTFRVQASPLLLGVENSDSYFMGPSSGRAFIETLKRKIQETGKSCNDFNPEAFLHLQGCQPLAVSSPSQTVKAPPRLFSDRCVNVYFQEWAPLFPVLHKPTFLRVYEGFVADPDKVKNNHKLAQLYLVFSIAGLSSGNPDIPQLAICEQQWTAAIDSILMDNTMNTLQCLVLALMYCTLRADYKRLQHYKAIAVSLSHRLGLHQSQKRFSFGALTIETRKKVFWTLYTLDCFTAAVLGLPKLLKEADVQTEYPSDVDDEYVTEKGFQPTLPGEYTRLSNALALFRATHILARVLEKNYPATSTHELSLQQMGELESELDTWYEGLPSHLRLNFVQDKPSTDVTGSRSPLLALAYYYIRMLIYRPAIGSSLGSKAAPALLSIGNSSKHIVQIIQLLEERNMSFSFCLNKGDLLVLCGMTMLYQVIDFKQDGKLMRDNERQVNSVIKVLRKAEAPGSLAFKRVANILISLDEPVEPAPPPKKLRERSMPAPSQRATPPGGIPAKKQMYPLGQRTDAAMSETELLQQQEKLRRMTMPTIAGGRPQLYRARSRQSFDTIQQDASLLQREQRVPASRLQMTSQGSTQAYRTRPNLDYLSLSHTPSPSQPISPSMGRMQPPASLPRHQQGQQNAQMGTKVSGISDNDWEALLGSMDGGVNNVYDAIYGGTALINEASMPATSDWSPDTWDLSSFNLGDFGGTPAPPQSVLSMSDESLSSGEELAPSELGLSVGSVEYRGQLLQTNSDGFIVDGLDTFPL